MDHGQFTMNCLSRFVKFNEANSNDFPIVLNYTGTTLLDHLAKSFGRCSLTWRFEDTFEGLFVGLIHPSSDVGKVFARCTFLRSVANFEVVYSLSQHILRFIYFYLILSHTA